MRHHPRKATEVIRILATNWQIVLIGMMLTAMTTTTFYLITAYTPTFGSHALHLNEQQTLLVTLCIGASNFIWLPIGGWLSDRIGRRPVLFSVPALTLLTAYPAMLWLVAEPDFTKLLVVELWFSFLFGIYNGAMVPFLTEIMPEEVRTAGFSLAYSLATAIFGGFTPAICTYLIEVTRSKAAPAMWLSTAAIFGLIGTSLSSRTERAKSKVALA